MNIIVDSACDFSKKVLEDRDMKVSMIPFHLQVGEDHFIDDENLDLDDYIKKMSAYNEAAKTAAPSPELYLEEYKKEGSAFVVTISHKLSASYNSALIAKQMYLDDIGDKFIHVFDSLSASVGETVIALRIDEYIKSKMSDADIVNNVNKFISEMRTYLVLERYDNLVKNGRLNPYIAKIASMLSIKPVCTAVDGEIEMVDKARGTYKALKKMVDTIVKDTINFEDRTLAIAHVKCVEKAQWVKEEVMKAVNFKDIVIVETAGLCTTYADVDGIVVAY